MCVQSPAQREMRQEEEHKAKQAVTVTCYTDGGICAYFSLPVFYILQDVDSTIFIHF